MDTKAKQPQPVTALTVLNKMKELVSRHEFKTKAISLDSLALSLNIKPTEIIILVKELEVRGHVKWNIPLAVSKRTTNMGTVSLITEL